ncbi:hypothetical protein Afil01_26210 [Actinorhabdospora filicis]|uniref:Uncharacterized protein n=1 Tax=Actinorhabdospora filicis TaxID=1785913 RepID=A0A9W6SLB2_9ACTN|nr:hypothetical protein [Actinorhabdospora filicis]GLZ77814.1 hypothetical protein Afil01_26210 [Actinorhabdospora filicis]
MSTSDGDGFTVASQSPDGSVRVRLALGGPAEVELHGPITRTHTETALAEQTRAALSAAVRAFHKTRRARLGISEEPGTGPETPRTRMKAEFESRVEALAFTVASPGGEVKVGWGGPDRVQVGIRPGALLRRARPELAGEIAGAVNAALARFSEEVVRAHAAVYIPKYWREM